ncbi:hypothetical protein [Mycolicibacterium komossense]|uniref:Haemophore haem-binding domain-containing protein n=1 Tax=Mycolicibacterium komossense TaxID=1779 RepID=A0ABT3CFL8_9MYCO|nr:hypothetical protein [Mycolicibacterium komossense]MCV7228287.1 hypothetical protein [Mycolicibacterium komossense]
MALVAIAVAIGAWFRPANEAHPASPPDSKSQFSEEQITEAKKAACSAYDKTTKAVSKAASLNSPDPTMTFVIAVNTRLATQFSSRFISDTLDSNPATPSDIAQNLRELTSAWDEIVLAQLSEIKGDDPTLKPAFDQLDSADQAIAQACK